MTESPFKLLESYGAGDKNIFFGRDSEIYALYNLLQQTQLALVYGASGTGKTSLINAGLPKVFKIADWFKISVRRRDNINDSLCAAVGSYLDAKPTVEELPDAVRHVFEKRWIPVYLVFDQFEELFTLSQDEGERTLFFSTLKAIMEQNTAVKIVLSMREEYIGHLYDYEHILSILFEKRFRVEAMKDDTICTVISRTCRVHGIQLEDGDSTAKVIQRRLKTGKQSVHLPYLQIYLHSLYGRAVEMHSKARFTEDLIKHDDYTLEKVLNRFIGGKISDAQALLKEKYPHIPSNFAEALLDDFATDSGTKRALRAQELVTKHKQTSEVVRLALQYFDENAKLLRADEDEVERYEPVHDVVASQIHERRTKEDKEFNKFVRDIETDYERWLTDKTLLQESTLNKVEVYRERLKGREEYKERWEVLVETSKKHHDDVRWWKKVRNIVLVVITVIAVAASVWAMISNGEAQKNRKTAQDAVLVQDSLKNAAISQLDSIQKVYRQFIVADSLRILGETNAVLDKVNDILDRAKKLDHTPPIANSLVKDAKNLLLPHRERNPRLKAKLEEINKIIY